MRKTDVAAAARRHSWRVLTRTGHALASVATVLAIVGCTPPNEYQAPEPPEVTVATPLIQTVTSYLEETGSTEAVGLVQIRARVRGFIDEVKFKTEDDVAVDDVLYVIEKQIYQAEVNKAKANLAIAQADYVNADARYRAAVPLAEKQVVTREELDQRKAERAVAQATIYDAQADLQLANINLGYCEVTSPIAGRVGKTLVDVGNLVDGSQATHLTTVINFDEIYANFYISERVFQDIIEHPPHRKSGEKLDKLKVKMYLSRFIDGDEYPFEGHLDYWDLEVEESTGTYPIRGIFPNPDRRLAPGMTVKIRVPMGEVVDAILLPEACIGTDQRGRFVMTIGPEGKVERHEVALGERVGGMQVILSGVTPEDRVVVEGTQRARIGATVTPVAITLPPLETDGVQTFRSESPDGEALEAPRSAPLDESVGALFDEEAQDAGDQSN